MEEHKTQTKHQSYTRKCTENLEMLNSILFEQTKDTLSYTSNYRRLPLAQSNSAGTNDFCHTKHSTTSLRSFCSEHGRPPLYLLQHWAKSLLNVLDTYRISSVLETNLSGVRLRSFTDPTLILASLNPNLLGGFEHTLGMWLLEAATSGIFPVACAEHLEAINDSTFRSFLHQCLNPETALVTTLRKHKFLRKYTDDWQLSQPVSVFYLEIILEEPETQQHAQVDSVLLSLTVSGHEGNLRVQFRFELNTDTVRGVAIEMIETLGANWPILPILERLIRKKLEEARIIIHNC